MLKKVLFAALATALVAAVALPVGIHLGRGRDDHLQRGGKDEVPDQPQAASRLEKGLCGSLEGRQ